ncbi:MAG: TIR domain-containing protein [Methylococcaceae bacterium]|nr:TIR domain-containing protein [Methylococcaceae bacterium]
MVTRVTVIFICHASRDEEYVRDFVHHVGPVLQSLGSAGLRFWEDSMIFAGSVWNKEIQNAISNSIAALIIVSDNLMNSSYAMTNELPRFLEEAEQHKVDIFCLYARECLIDEMIFRICVNGIQKEVKLTDYQGLNSPNTPLESFHFRRKQKHELIQAARKMLAALKPRLNSLGSAPSLARATVSGIGR